MSRLGQIGLIGKIHKMDKRVIDGVVWVQVELDFGGAVEGEGPAVKACEGAWAEGRSYPRSRTT